MFLILGTIFISSQTTITLDDVFKELKENDARGTAIFTLDTQNKIIDKKDFEIIFDEVCGYVESYELVIPKTCWENETTCYDIINNKTKEIIQNCTTEEINYECNTPITSLTGIRDYKIIANISEDWCLIGNTYYRYSIDWKPKIIIDGKIYQQDKWSWWNATGGTITIDGDYTVHTFTSSGVFTIQGNGTTEIVEVLVVAGGGGGSRSIGAGGGAGGLIHNNSYNVTGNITVVVGTGGIGAPEEPLVAKAGGNGTNSSFGVLVAAGGGGGAGWDTAAPGNGGSGGGAVSKDSGQAASYTPGSGIIGQGSDGGWGDTGGGNICEGGGGGASGIVLNATLTVSGNGTAGLNYSINGTNMYYAGGGGGGGYSDCGQGFGGIGGGGDGGADGGGNDGSPGVNGTGGGGGGGHREGAAQAGGGNGGDGIVIARYLTPGGAAPPAPASGLRFFTNLIDRLLISGSGNVTIYENLTINKDLDVVGDLTSGTIQADDGYTGDCVNTSFVGGIATGCND